MIKVCIIKNEKSIMKTTDSLYGQCRILLIELVDCGLGYEFGNR